LGGHAGKVVPNTTTLLINTDVKEARNVNAITNVVIPALSEVRAC